MTFAARQPAGLSGEEAYRLAVTSALAGAETAALRLFRQALPGLGLGNLLAWPHPLATRVAELRDRIETTLRQSSAVPLPEYVRQRREPGPWQTLQDKRILFLLPQYVRGDTGYVESPSRSLYVDTAVTAGLRADWFCLDQIHRIGDSGTNQAGAQDRLRDLLEFVEASKPGIVFFSCNELGSPDGLGVELISRIRELSGCRTIAVMGDAWGAHSVQIARYWAGVCDLIYHCAPYSLLGRDRELARIVWWGAPPIDRTLFHRGSPRTIDLFFSGSCANHLRPFWLSLARLVARRRRLRHHLVCHDRRQGDNVPTTTADYAALLRKAHMVINFSTRDATYKAMTGRPWQGIISECLVLEESNDYLAAYFTEYMHYIPFTTAQDLVACLTLFAREPDIATAVAQQGADFALVHYDEVTVWREILGALAQRISA